MKIVLNPDDAASLLARGEIVAIPTDTVYGLAALLTNESAVQGLFEAKGRRSDVPLPILVADIAQLEGLLGPLDGPGRTLTSFWPGPLTIVLDCQPELAAVVGSVSTVGIRCPDDAMTLALLERTGPLAVTSANHSGEPPATSAEEVVAALGAGGRVTAVLDAGPRQGVPSTVVRLAGDTPEIVRQGTVSAAQIAEALRRA